MRPAMGGLVSANVSGHVSGHVSAHDERPRRAERAGHGKSPPAAPDLSEALAAMESRGPSRSSPIHRWRRSLGQNADRAKSGRRLQQGNDLVAPAELVSFARRERQPHESSRCLARVFPAPGLRIPTNGVVATLVPSARNSSNNRIRLRRLRVVLPAFVVSIRSRPAFQRPSRGRG